MALDVLPGRNHRQAAMCNLYTQSKSVDEVAALFRDLQMPLRFPDGVPNLEPRDIAITDPAPIVRAARDEPGTYELVVRRWSWPGPGGKPVFNLRSDGREFDNGRCLALADGFYEFTAATDARSKRKDRWMFRRAEGGMLAIAGLVRPVSGFGEAFTLLTTNPGADVARLHHRQIALIDPPDWRAWLDNMVSAKELLGPSPAGTLVADPAPRST